MFKVDWLSALFYVLSSNATWRDAKYLTGLAGSWGEIGGCVWIPTRAETWPCTCTGPPLCEPSTALHHAVNWRLHRGRTDSAGLSRTYVPTNPGELGQRPGSHFTKRSCWWLAPWVCSDMQMGGWTWYRTAACSRPKTRGLTSGASLLIWTGETQYYNDTVTDK